ncbi:MAG TPA: hypothetical protein VEL49_08760 [Ktedonobacteraceae bacterium]|nr:hypothetical protein [Ktedonobacteraceae bacterium]
MKLQRSPTFYTISLAVVGAVFGCVLFIYSQLWLAILSGVISVLLVILSIIAQAYQNYMEQNKYRFQALARMGQHTPGLIDYCRDNVKLWWKGRHPTCHDCRKSVKRSQAAWLYAPIGHWNEALQEIECGKMWLCSTCIERRLRETANQAHLANEISQHWKTKAEQLQAQVGNLESELVAKRSEGSHN